MTAPDQGGEEADEEASAHDPHDQVSDHAAPIAATTRLRRTRASTGNVVDLEAVGVM
jgi:hypothetical protein